MADLQISRSLTVKLLAFMLAAMMGAIILFLSVTVLGGNWLEELYFGESMEYRLNDAAGDFRTYVAQEHIASTNVNAVGRWNREHPNLSITVYGKNTTISSTPGGAELSLNSAGFVIRSETLDETGREYPVNFTDAVCTVAIYDTSRTVVEAALTLVALIFAALVLLVTVLLYNRSIIRTVQTLSRQVRQVSRGDLQMQIQPESNDEIGQLALDVDAMRLSIIDKLQREEAAWQANSQLITAISHDVRTPLTALMGYLEILSDDAITPTEHSAYLDICKNNARRLKGLTDELFGFFLVFGRPEPEKVLETFDAATLLDQLLLEHELGLQQRGFQVQVQQEPVSGLLQVDLGHFQRVFANLFSNVRKYADPTKPVTITQKLENGDLVVSIQNYINPAQTRVESNRIGLQTCNKLVAAMGGEFSQSRTKDTFLVEVLLPLYQQTPAGV